MLPSRIPIHFGINGKADSFGPRPLLWITVGAQLIFAALYAALYLTGHKRGMLVIGVGVTAILLRAQIRIVSAAITGSNRVPVGLYRAVSIYIGRNGACC